MTLEIRPARPEDREAILDISTQVWEGHDYLSQVWESWLHDPAGPLMVALLAGRPAAVDKIILQGPDEAWLAGIRVDPAQRGQGIANALLAHNLRWLEDRHIRVVRFTTASDNTPVHRMAQRFGFRHVVSVRRFVRPLERATPTRFPRVLSPAEEGMAWDRLRHSGFLRITHGLYGVGWTWLHFTYERLQEHLQQGEVLAWGDGPAALGIVRHRSHQMPRRVAMLVGDREAGLAMVQALLHDPDLVVEDPEHPPQLRLTVPEGLPDLDWIVEQAGLVRRWNLAMWLFQRDRQERPL